jgi:hypothetical protein
MAVDTSLGFRYRGRVCGAPPTIQNLLATSTATYHKGDLLALGSGLVEIAASNGNDFLGVCLETKACTASVTTLPVVVDADAIYGAYDTSARVKGTILDITGTTGAMTLAADVDSDVRVYAASAADEETLVVIAHGTHIDTVTVT